MRLFRVALERQFITNSCFNFLTLIILLKSTLKKCYYSPTADKLY